MPEEGFQWSVPEVVISPNIVRKFCSLASPFFLNLPQPRVDAAGERDSEVQARSIEVSTSVEIKSAAGGGEASGAGGDATLGWCSGWEPAGMAV